MNQKTQPSPALFDEHGRRIVGKLAHPANTISRRYFKIEQPEIDYAAIFERISGHLGKPANLSAPAFEERAKTILKRLDDTPTLKNLNNGVYVPFFLPRNHHDDIGKALEATYITAVSASFAASFPQYRFDNHHKAGLEGKLTARKGSRHDVLIEKLNTADIVGCYFPCLTEFSVPATLEQMSELPAELLLAGGYDTCAALVGSPGLLQRHEGYANMLWLAGLQGEAADADYYFEAYGQNLTFNRRVHFGQVSEYWASGLVVLG